MQFRKSSTSILPLHCGYRYYHSDDKSPCDYSAQAAVHFSCCPRLYDEQARRLQSRRRYRAYRFRSGQGLRYRLECLSNIIGIKGGHIDPKLIDITFTRSLPQNELELSQVVATLDGKVPQETLLSLLPFVKDPQSAAEELRQQKQDAITAQQQMFMNTPLVRGESNEESE